MKQKVLKFLDFFIHDEVKGDVERLIKIRGLITLGLVFFVASIFTLIYSYNRQYTTILPIAAAISLYTGKLTGKHELNGKIAVLFFSGIVTLFLSKITMLHSLSVYWIPVLTWTAVYAGGPILGLVSTVSTIGTLAYSFYTRFSPELVAENGNYLIGIAIGNCVFYVFTLISDKTTKAVVAVAVDERQKLEAQKQITMEASKLSALGEMAGGIAHEINNPLTIIRGNAEVIQSIGRENLKVVERAGKIVGTVERVEKIINSMRNLSRQDSDDDFQSYKFAEIIEEALVFFREKTKSHGIELRVRTNLLVEVLANRIQLAQVVINLLNNAIDAIHENKHEHSWISVVLKISGDQVLLEISNSGKKIDAGLSESIMRPFFTTKSIGKGTGLGLSVSKRIAMKHGGDLNLDLDRNFTTFVLALPILDTEEKAS